MILTLIGKDMFTKERRIDTFLSEALGELKDDPLARQVVHASDTNIPSIAGLIMECCGTISMFTPEQAVVVRNADEMKAEESKALARWLKDAPDCKLLLDFKELRATAELYKILSKVGKVEKYDEPKSYKMNEWISAMVPTHFHKAIDPNASLYLADALGTNTGLVAQEVEKVLLFNPDVPKITLDLVKMLVVPQREIPPYEILNYFGLFDAKNYTRKLHEILYGGGDAIAVTNALYSHAVDLLNFMTLTSKGMSAEDACTKLGKNFFIFCKQGKAVECCRIWGKKKIVLHKVIRRLAELNYEFKSSSWTVTSQELALAALVVR